METAFSMDVPSSPYPPLPEFPLEAQSQRLVARDLGAQTLAAKPLYLDLAERLIDEAAGWVDENGVVIDPVEKHDCRWHGGTAARFICPAAILVRERGRADLVGPVTRAMAQLEQGILTAAARGGDFPRGVLDLVLKEIVIGVEALAAVIPEASRQRWRAALAALSPDAVYTLRPRLDGGRAPNNYAASAATGEWLRVCHGLAADAGWVDRAVAAFLPWFTEFGQFRDPADPALYDLMVRQNVCELLQWGYAGPLRPRLEELLRRGDLVTSMCVSPCGWAPFGGRSNLLLHNEAMVCYTAEFMARQWFAAERPDLAAASREVARRAAAAVAPFLQCRPPHAIKNHFAPATRHGKDSGYGEYANYALLAASLFARTARVVDDAIPVARAPAAAAGCLVNLWPAFHRVYATCGDTHVGIDARAQAEYDVTGVNRFQRAGAPPELALALGIPAHPRYELYGAETGRAVGIGPCWQAGTGEWQSLAALSDQIEGVTVTEERLAPDTVVWSMRWTTRSACELPVTGITQRFVLLPGSLSVLVRVDGVVRRSGFEVPCLITAGDSVATVTTADRYAVVGAKGWLYRIEVPAAEVCTQDPVVRANRNAQYRVLRYETSAASFAVRMTISCA